MDSRPNLQTMLEQILGSRNVYFQPPESLKLNYPAIVYKRSNIRNIAKSKLYFYYKSIRTDDGVFHILDKRKINWQNDVFKNDVIILESNYSGLGGVGYSFLSDAIIKLKKDLFKTEKELKTWQNDIKKKIIKQSKKNNINTILESEFNPFENKQ